MSDIARKLKQLRIERGLTQYELAKKLNVTQNAIHNWETGKREINISMLEKISIILNVPLKTFFEIEDEDFGTVYQLPFSSEEDFSEEALIKIFPHLAIDKKAEIEARKQAEEYIEIENLNKIIDNYDKLNHDGKQEAVKRIEELTEIKKYTE